MNKRTFRSTLAVLAGTLVAFGASTSTGAGASCTSAQDALSANKAAVVVTCLPAGATQVGVAELSDLNGTKIKYGRSIPAAVGTTITTDSSAYPVIDIQAKSASGAALGGFAGRLQTVPGGEAPKETKRQELEKRLTGVEASVVKLGKEKTATEAVVVKLSGELGTAQSLVQQIKGELNELPPEESQAEREAREAKEREAREKAEHEAKEKAEREAREKAEREQREKEEREKLEEPPHEELPGVVFHKGVDGGGWGEANELRDYKQLGTNVSVRLENPGNTAYLTSRGYYVVYLLNHYNKGGIKAVDANAYGKEVAAVHAQDPTDAIEVENEPGGNWFWQNPGAESQENATAYDHLLKVSHEACPVCVLYASADGGHAGDNAWLKKMLKADPNVVNYVTAFTEHPYDGSGANPDATLVHFGAVEEAHSLTGKPIDITEYGRPLATGTGDSPRSTEAQQAKADGAMVKKARSVGWVLGAEIYGYRGDGSPEYAIFKASGEPRLAVAAIAGG